MFMVRFRSIAFVVAIALCALSHAQQPTLAERFLLFALAEEQLMSASRLQYSAMVTRVGVITKPECVRRVQSRLEASLGRKLTINVLNDRSFNASAYPHGDMFINIGAVEALNEDEDMIAAILGHEVSHVRLKHSLKRFQHQLLVNTVVAGFLTGGDYEQLAPYLSAAITSRYSRDNELEADRYGFVCAVKAGYAPTGAMRSFQTMASLDSGRTIGLFDSHPPSEYRARQMEKLATSYQEGVPLEWLESGLLTHDLHRLIGAPPSVVVGESPFMKVSMNLPGAAFTKSDYPRFAIDIRISGNLAILKLSPDGKAGLLLPNPFEPSGAGIEGETIEVPSTEYRTQKGDLVRLKWDQTGTFQYLFVLTESRVDFGSVVGKTLSRDELEVEAKAIAKSQKVLVIDTTQATISVSTGPRDTGG